MAKKTVLGIKKEKNVATAAVIKKVISDRMVIVLQIAFFFSFVMELKSKFLNKYSSSEFSRSLAFGLLRRIVYSIPISPSISSGMKKNTS
ncbi:MAG: hypothetical protein K6G72_00895 [Lachnospiraceae bacterium]|nr:hypothetical protein [Lachnospiraceae bacterium]